MEKDEIIAIKAGLDKKFEGLTNELADINKGTEKLASKDTVLKLHEDIKTQGEALVEINEKLQQRETDDFGKEINSWLTEKHQDIQDLYEKGSGNMLFTPKAVGDMSTASGTSTGADANQNARLNNVNLRNDQKLINLAQSFNTDQMSFPYTEVAPKEGGYAGVAEGGTKPQIDHAWVTRYATPKKIAAYEILSEEVIRDIPRMESVAKDFLKKKHDLFKANQMYFGDGTGANPSGATVYGRVFSAGAMADAFALGGSNFMDVLNACVTDIYETHNFVDESSYEADIAMISPTDYFLNISAAKDTRGLPLFPQASLFSDVKIGAAKVMPWAKIPAGKIFVGDMSKYNITNWVPYSVRIGWINAQFISNEFTMVGESRFHAFVKNFDQQAFIYDDIATIVLGLEAVA